MSHRIVVLDGIYANPGDLSWDPLKDLGKVTVYDQTPIEEVIERSKEAQILIVNKIKLGKTQFDQLPHLKLVVISATGMDNVDLIEAASRNIIVKNVSGYSTRSVAQHVFSLILAKSNQVSLHSESVKSGKWNDSKGFCYTVSSIPELSKLKLGIYGFGKIGQEVAKIGAAFGMQIMVVSKHASSFDYPGIQTCDLNELFQECDIISLHSPLFPDNKQIINSALFALAKPTLHLINTARGALVNENDLLSFLNSNPNAFASLDVLNIEPPGSVHPLFDLSNCTITPHMAWTTRESRSTLLNTVFNHIREFQKSR